MGAPRGRSARRCSDVDGCGTAPHVQQRCGVIEKREWGILEIGFEEGRVQVGISAKSAMFVVPSEPVLPLLVCFAR